MFFFFKTQKKEAKIYTALEIANYIVNKCLSDKKPISNLQLQKILYFLQVEFLQNQKHPLFSDEIEAWTFGPVVRQVYYKFCGFGSSTLFELSNDNIVFDSEDKTLIDNIIEKYREKNPWDLVALTHQKNKAWDIIYKNGEGDKKIIPKEIIAAYG